MNLTETKIESIRVQLKDLATEHNITIDALRRNPNLVPFPGSIFAKTLVMAERDLVFEEWKQQCEEFAQQWDGNGVLKKRSDGSSNRPTLTLIMGGKK